MSRHDRHNSPSQSAVRMLVLETDETHPDTQAERGSFGDVFNDLFQQAGREHDPPLSIEVDMHFIVESDGKGGHVPKADEIGEDVDAILITGSMYDAHGDQEWILKLIDLIQTLWKQRGDNLKFSGVCFGHQVLSRALGATVEGTPGGEWELAHTEMDLTSVGQQLFRTNDSKLYLHQMHQDQVTTVPSSSTTSLLDSNTKVHVWASTPHTKIQGLYIRDRLFTSQGHLGFDENMVRRQVEMRVESGGIKEDEVAEEAKERAHLEHDGVVVAKAILRFFHGEDHGID